MSGVGELLDQLFATNDRLLGQLRASNAEVDRLKEEARAQSEQGEEAEPSEPDSPNDWPKP